ncbi:adenylate kinase [Bacterioplanes sanyensis]|uniref:Adenylate kinase n=1 Tax=Bacterioplanes sanyensis TaxID=1249553 RepID=A0A222FL03_9GAMM|nr:adenylate kinase [Bacterioplanes sanyensis]ASP39342.1 adenylate kinase [Bacterioplanes sanyensis]
MKKVAIFGKPGSGKSSIAKKLASCTNIPLHLLDTLAYTKDGRLVAAETFKQSHDVILQSDSWIIDGLGPINCFHERIAAADTLIYIDLPYPTCYWFVFKRMIKGLWEAPLGWPAGSSVLKGSIQSFKTLRLCPKFWNEDFKKRIMNLSDSKSIHIISSTAELDRFLSDTKLKSE